MSDIIIDKAEACLIKCRVQPSASKTSIAGIYNEQLKISLAAPPVDGKANKALRDFIAKKLKMPKSSVTVIKGLKSRSKTVACTGITKVEVETILGLNNEQKT